MKRWELLSPTGLGAVAVLQLDGDVRDLDLVDHAGERVSAVADGRVRHAILRDEGRTVDEVLLVGTPGGLELHLHGGEVLLAEVTALLRRCGFESTHHDGSDAPRPLSLRYVRALISNRSGPLAELMRREGEPGPASRDLDRVLRLRAFASRLVRPAVVRIVGLPNAGKSTLFNAWVGRERALVSPQAGTTRDTVRATVLLRGVPIVLEDTPGNVPGGAAGAGADLIVHLLTQPDEAGSLKREDPALIEVLGRSDEREVLPGMRAISGRTGAGLDELLDAVSELLSISTDRADDAWAPVDAGHARCLEGTVRDRANQV